MTCSVADPKELQRCRRQVFLALLVALATALHALESLLPSPFPWFRLGLANIFTLVALELFGSRAAWTLVLLRIGLGALLLGRFLTPGFFLALGGGLLAVFSMTLAKRLAGSKLGPVGLSVLGAAGHVSGQLLVAWLLLVRHPGVWKIYPVLLLVAVGSGIINGLVADSLLQALGRHPALLSFSGRYGKSKGE